MEAFCKVTALFDIKQLKIVRLAPPYAPKGQPAEAAKA